MANKVRVWVSSLVNLDYLVELECSLALLMLLLKGWRYKGLAWMYVGITFFEQICEELVVPQRIFRSPFLWVSDHFVRPCLALLARLALTAQIFICHLLLLTTIQSLHARTMLNALVPTPLHDPAHLDLPLFLVLLNASVEKAILFLDLRQFVPQTLIFYEKDVLWVTVVTLLTETLVLMLIVTLLF